jgi:hypothetical protein
MDQLIRFPSDSDIPCTLDSRRYKDHPCIKIYATMIEDYTKAYYNAKQLRRVQQKAAVTRITGDIIGAMKIKQLCFIKPAEWNGKDVVRWRKMVDKNKARDMVRHALMARAENMNNHDSSGSAHTKDSPFYKSFRRGRGYFGQCQQAMARSTKAELETARPLPRRPFGSGSLAFRTNWRIEEASDPSPCALRQ